MNMYYFFFGIVVILTQAGIDKVVDKFRFLNYYWGKGSFCLFLCSLAFANNQETFVKWILGLYFLICAVCFFVLTFIDKQQDKE